MAIVINFAGKIKGNSTVEKHENWVTADSMQFGVGRSISGAAGGKSREVSNPSFSEITLTRSTDISSPEIYKSAIGGKALGDVQIHLYQTYENTIQVYLMMTLKDAIISQYTASSAGDRPTESFSVNFTKVEYQYDDFDGKTKTTGTPVKWDVMGNRAY